MPTPYADGGAGRGNYAVFNAVRPGIGVGQSTLSNGNLTATSTAGGSWPEGAYSSIAVSSGKWYCEITPTSGIAVAGALIGVASASTSYWYYSFNGNKYTVTTNNGAYGASYADNDVIGIALDLDAGTLAFYKNGVSQGTAFSGLTGEWVFGVGDGSGGVTVLVAHANFGQRPFAYTPPTGFKALNTQNLPEPTVARGNRHFDVVTRTGNNSSFSVTGLQFSPDFFWTKCRNTALAHYLADTVRGDDNILFSNLTSAEFSEPQYITAISSDGYTLGAGSNAGNYNGTGGTYVDWLWKASDSAAVSNTAGSITSTVSANPTAGFSVVTYTTTGSASTVGHGLGVAPRMLITKQRNGTTAWYTYHASIGATNFVLLNSTAAQASSSVIWNNTAPTSSVFSLGSGFGSGETYVAYCFAPVAGYSAFGSYTGNGSTDGPFVFCGFRPKFVMIKVVNNTYDWEVADSSRSPDNFVDDFLVPNSSAAENANVGAANSIDFLSNGFKIRANWTRLNEASGTYIYMAFAENPFKNALAR